MIEHNTTQANKEEEAGLRMTSLTIKATPLMLFILSANLDQMQMPFRSSNTLLLANMSTLLIHTNLCRGLDEPI
jgi:hypothetical protein